MRVAADCTRIGKPADETLCIVAWDPEIDRCAILPPQVFFTSHETPDPTHICLCIMVGFILCKP